MFTFDASNIDIDIRILSIKDVEEWKTIERINLFREAEKRLEDPQPFFMKEVIKYHGKDKEVNERRDSSEEGGKRDYSKDRMKNYVKPDRKKTLLYAAYTHSSSEYNLIANQLNGFWKYQLS